MRKFTPPPRRLQTPHRHLYFLSNKEKKKENKNKKDVLLDATVYKGIQTIDWLPVCLFLRQCKNSLVPEFLATMLQRGCPT